MFIAGLAALFTFALGGFVRERSRQPFNVYEQLVKVEALPAEKDRVLVYQKCVDCHHASPAEFERYKPGDWAERVEIERNRPGLDLSDEEAERITRYLEEHY